MRFDLNALTAVFQYPGGKARLADWIVSLLPSPCSYSCFIDVFGGAASVLLGVMRRDKATGNVVYVYNDADEEIVNFFRVLRNPRLRRRLRRMLRWTPYSRKVFEECREMPALEDPVKRAWRFFVIVQQSFACKGAEWSYHLHNPRRIHKWVCSQNRFECFGEAFRCVEIECADFSEIISRYSGSNVLLYCDPPYYPEALSSHGNLYRLTMPKRRHKELAEYLNAFPGMVALSGYRCPEYDEWYAGWERHDKEVVCSLSSFGSIKVYKERRKPHRVESLWLNPKAVKARKNLVQPTLF